MSSANQTRRNSYSALIALLEALLFFRLNLALLLATFAVEGAIVAKLPIRPNFKIDDPIARLLVTTSNR